MVAVGLRLLAPRGTRGGVRERARNRERYAIWTSVRDFTPTLSLQRPPAAGARAAAMLVAIRVSPPVYSLPPLLL